MPSEHQRAPRLATRNQQGGCSMSIRSYKDLDVWQRGVELAAMVDELAEKLVRGRRFAMANQICRAALSVPSNIAEGNGRVHRLEYAHHVSMARGSLLEVESILYVRHTLQAPRRTRMRQGIHADHGHREHADEAAPRALPRLSELTDSGREHRDIGTSGHRDIGTSGHRDSGLGRLLLLRRKSPRR